MTSFYQKKIFKIGIIFQMIDNLLSLKIFMIHYKMCYLSIIVLPW